MIHEIEKDHEEHVGLPTVLGPPPRAFALKCRAMPIGILMTLELCQGLSSDQCRTLTMQI